MPCTQCYTSDLLPILYLGLQWTYQSLPGTALKALKPLTCGKGPIVTFALLANKPKTSPICKIFIVYAFGSFFKTDYKLLTSQIRRPHFGRTV